jgi:biopolymer transport protein ExbD
MKFRRNKDKTISYIDMTALVDMVVVVLIFFMYTSASPVKTTPVNLPGSNSGDALTQEAVLVAISQNGILINGRNSQESDLKALPKDKDIVIMAPKDIQYFRVITMLDILKSSGHQRISLATKPLKY